MVKFINGHTGSAMWVHESRIGEYLAAGHKLAAGTQPVIEKKLPAKKKTATKK